MKNSGRAEFDKVLLVMRSTKRCQRLTNLFFCEAICTQNRSDWMEACINHLYCIGITLSTSPQKVFCHGLGNLWLYPSGKVGPRKVFNNPRKLFERYRWMEKSFGLSDEIVHTTKSTTTMAHLNSPLFRSDDDICLHLCNPSIMKTLLWALLLRPNTKLN